ncbi:MAG: UDP-N-acetylmuramoyl-L-alanyl-D-glutamate--2,6-diaminopimelate ligase [Chloroflexi bacterium]|nr:MAG: UDP-N-acetylmuramoyl-L-alanyl-D-glutamate--2,6-diaminopimelate ligase [Chloroflexota bacterium]
MTGEAPAIGPPGGSMGLGALTDRIGPERVVGVPIGEITSLAYDSRKVSPEALFFAVPGEHTDGHHYVTDAVEAGARAVVVQHELPDVGAPQLVVANSRYALADAADVWFGEPSRHLATIGVTGTNGKTTVTSLCAQILAAAGDRPGLLGTVNVQVGDRLEENLARATTPEALELQELLARMVAAGNNTAVIETSSHGLALGRVRNCRYRAAVLTNLTHEHLEFHGTFEAYRDAKALLVEEAPLAILNRDDPSWAVFREHARDRVLSYGVHQEADVRASDLRVRSDGSRLAVAAPDWTGNLEIPLPGSFNIENALAAFTFALGWGIDPDLAAQTLATAHGVSGRMERVDLGQPFNVVIDYAHSPDAIEKMLRVLRSITAGRLIALFGSAGERDLLKRPEMGRIAAELADLVVVTDEDPRAEDPDEINRQIADGARAAGARDDEDLWVINDRRTAIAHAIGLAQPGDTILLAGKGHEHNMFVASGSVWWDEAEVTRQELDAAGHPSTGDATEAAARQESAR